MSSDSDRMKKAVEKLSPSEFVRQLRKEKEAAEGFDYRRASLALHGHICARCGREFEGADLRLLTVHHKDGNHYNNPRDGSNWENLCIYCHEDIHARGVLASMINGGDDAGNEKPSEENPAKSKSSDGMVSMADKLRKLLDEGK